MKIYLLIFVSSLIVACCENSKKPINDSVITLSKAMGDVSEENFNRAMEKRKFIFPEDHGPHPDFRTEWWYVTGNLTSDSEDERQFGYQFTIFRTALSKDKSNRNSHWSFNHIYMAHFAVTDISDDEFYFDERFSRDGNELAGAQINPFKVWLEDWQVAQVGDKYIYDLPVLNIIAKSENAEINLLLESLKPFVLQGDEGLSQKGKQQGNASYYYSYTKLITAGNISLNGIKYTVKGFSWLDREWSTSALSEDQVGWDWFALQLDDSTEIMYYQMRKSDGTPDVFSKGITVMRDGYSKLIKKDDFSLEVTSYWESSLGVKYPSGWNLNIPIENIKLEITPTVKNQLWDVSINYWEGSVRIEGMKDKEKIYGRGYVELTGY
jgi:predicted secreted hydrolase